MGSSVGGAAGDRDGGAQVGGGIFTTDASPHVCPSPSPSPTNSLPTADCAQGGKPKAEAAAEAMRRIFPGVNTAGHTLTIPMPGHSVETELEEAKAATEKLDELVRSHDVTFLLTDTRESRWLPTVLCSTYDKCLIDVALGQESFLVIRHGAGALHEEDANGAAAADVKRLGCYFCNDCVAPRNSQSNRTLDQRKLTKALYSIPATELS